MHRLDNDLKALRLVHLRIIDTAVMYPHKSGAPYKRALKDV
jgi:RNA exonuclease 1